MSQDIDIPNDADVPLNESGVVADPILQFEQWLDAARTMDLIEPTAMTLATAAADGAPSARIVLLKAVEQAGFVFFTNYDSRKGRELAANPRAALVTWWPPLHRQVRIEGAVAALSDDESDAYHRTRGRGRQLAAWISRQSSVIQRADLEHDFQALQARYADRDIPRPPFWGGYRLNPTTIEFWQGRRDRLHDRLRYHRSKTGGWNLERLAP